MCKSISDLTSIITKSTNRKVSKRDLQLVDRTSRIVSCTLWGAEAEGFEASNFPIVVIKGARVSDFGGRSLNTVMSSMIALDPDIPEAHQLRGWFDNVGKNEESSSITGLKGGGGECHAHTHNTHKRAPKKHTQTHTYTCALVSMFHITPSRYADSLPQFCSSERA